MQEDLLFLLVQENFEVPTEDRTSDKEKQRRPHSIEDWWMNSKDAAEVVEDWRMNSKDPAEAVEDWLKDGRKAAEWST
jgi:hypothetical protein